MKSLRQWARENGMAVRTAYNQFHANTLTYPRSKRPVPAFKAPSGSIWVEETEPDPLDYLDIHELARRLESAGWVFAQRPAGA